MAWINAPEAGSAEARERNDVMDCLKNPLKFGTKELRYLEKNRGTLDAKEKRLFRDVAGYFFSLAQNSSSRALPPFMLAQIEKSSLMSLLPDKLKAQIENALNKQMQELADFAVKASEATEEGESSVSEKINATEVARATILYRRLRGRVRGDSEWKPIFDNVQKSLLGWSINALREASISSRVADTLEGASSRKARFKALGNQEKVLVANIYHMFPGSSDWVDHCDASDAKKYALEAFDALKENPSDPSAVLSWNIAENWMADESHEMNQAMKARFDMATLEKQFGRLRAVELLQFAKSQRVFLPAHLRALKSLKGNKDILPVDTIEEWGNLTEEKEQLEELDEKIKELEKNYDATKKQEVEKFIKSDKNNKKVKSYLEDEEKKKTSWDELKAEFDKFDESDVDGDEIKDLKKRLEDLEEGVIDEDLADKLKLEVNMVEGKDAAVDEFNEKFDKFYNAKLDLLLAEAEVITDMPASGKFNETLKKFEAEKGELKKAQEAAIAKIEAEEEWNDVYANAEEYIEKADENFWHDLNDRVKNRHLHAADFDVLWSGEFDEEVYVKLDDVPEKDKVFEFRKAFADILPGIFEGVNPPAEDRYDLWYTALEERLSYENIIARLAESGYDLRAEFEAPQQVSHLIEGAVTNFRDDIFAQAKKHLADDKHDEFYGGWERLHGRLMDNVVDPAKVHVDHVNYERGKQDTARLLQEEQEKNMVIIDGLRQKGLHEEADKLEAAWEVRKNWYRNGGRMAEVMENGEIKNFWAPGKDILTELQLQTRSVQSEINKITSEEIREPISVLKKEYQELAKMPDGNDKRQRFAKLRAQLQGVFGAWPGQKKKLENLLKDHQTVMEHILPDDNLAFEFANDVYAGASEWIEKLDDEIFDWKTAAESSDFSYTGQEPCWEKISKFTQKFESVIDFDKGQFVEESAELDDYLGKDTETVEFLDSANFFEDDSADKGEFKKVYSEQSEEFRKSLADYEASFATVRSKLRGDMKKLSDDEFVNKYGMMNKEYMEELINQHDNQLNTFRSGANKFLNPSFYNSWLRKYNESPEARVNALEDMSKFRNLAAWATESKNQTTNMKVWLDEWQPGTGKNIKSYQQFALYDLYAIVKQAVEVNRHKWEIRSGIAVANIGVSFFGRYSNWGKEFYRKSQEFEGSRVKEIEGEIDDDPWWTNQEQLYNSNDQDEARACINKLIEKGVFRWDDPKLWKTLMRLSGNAVNFSDADKNKDISDITEKCKEACEFIWSREVFRAWDNSLESKTKSQEDSFGAEFQRLEHMSGMREQILGGMLDNWNRGKKEGTDPSRFASYIRQAFAQGKMNGGPLFDSRWFYAIQGVKCGLLSRDFFGRLNGEFLANMPYFDFFTDKSEWKKDGRIVPAGTPGAEQRAWVYEDYVGWADFLSKGTNDKFDVGAARKNMGKFFYEYVYQSGAARGRMERMVRNGTKSFDHDDAAMFAAGLNAENITKMLNTTSTDEDKYTPDFWRNILDGYKPYFEGIANYIKEGDAEHGADNPGWQKIKERNFIEVADRLKAMLIVSHSVAGNFNINERKPIVFSQADFEKSDAYSVSAQQSFDAGHEVLFELLDIAGKKSDYESLVDQSTWHRTKGTVPPAKESKNAELLQDVLYGKKDEKTGQIKKKEHQIHTRLFNLIKGPASKEIFTNKNVEKMLMRLAE